MSGKVMEYVNYPVTSSLETLRTAIHIPESSLRWCSTLDQALNSYAMRIDILEDVLRSLSIRLLLNDLHDVFYIDWTGDVACPVVTFDQVRMQFLRWGNVRTQAERDNLHTLASQYISTLKKELLRNALPKNS